MVERRAARVGQLVRWDVVVALLLAAVLAYGFNAVDNFGSTINLSFLIGNTMAVALVALPMTMLVVAGEVDLSVGSMAGLSSALMGALWNANWPIEYIIPFCILVGAAGGALNGLLVTRLGLPSLAVTIGTLAAYRGLAQIVLGANSVTDFPQNYLNFGAGRIGATPIPYTFVLYAVLLLAAAITLHATPIGRSLFAVGANHEAAFFAGIRVRARRGQRVPADGDLLQRIEHHVDRIGPRHDDHCSVSQERGRLNGGLDYRAVVGDHVKIYVRQVVPSASAHRAEHHDGPNPCIPLIVRDDVLYQGTMPTTAKCYHPREGGYGRPSSQRHCSSVAVSDVRRISSGAPFRREPLRSRTVPRLVRLRRRR